MRVEFKLILAIALIVSVLFGWAWSSRAEVLEIWNCDPSMAIGWVKWDIYGKEYTSSDVDVYGAAITVYDKAEPGKTYAITQYHSPSGTIVDFKEIEIKPGEKNVIKFSCREE